MATKRIPLAIYRIRNTMGGKPVKKFEDAIANPNDLTRYDLVGDYDFKARLFVAEPKENRPPWVDFLEGGFGEGELAGIKDSVTNKAVLIAKVNYDEKDIFFAITFGFGRYLLRPNSIKRKYGLHVTLNAFYPTDYATEEQTFARIRRVVADTLAANTLHASLQVDRRTTFEDFGIDMERDLLRAITGQPVDMDRWGTRLTGSSALLINRALDIKDLGDLLRQIERTSRRDDYKERFEWIDNIKPITDIDVLHNLEATLLDNLKNKEIERLQLAPPEIVDWDKLAFFHASIKPEEHHDDLELELGKYLDILEDEGKLYLFGWGDIARKNSRRPMEFLKNSLKIEWLENAEIKKSDDGKTIIVTNEENSLTFKLNEAENKVALEISGGGTREYILRKEKGKLNIYGKLTELTIEHLREHKLDAVDVNGNEAYSWPLFRCISGELDMGGRTYLINGGDFFEISSNYLRGLNAYIKRLPESRKALPDSEAKTPEGEYNELAANISPNYLLLDKKTVRVKTRTSPIEICDILTDDGRFIHVKRKLASASLSHLFAQGYVSAELFHMSQEYREAMLDEIKEAEKERAEKVGEPTILGRFSSFSTTGITPSRYEVVYAIVANWKGRDLVDALPFFSKVNLRRYAKDLRRMGYKVSYNRIQAD